MSGAASPFADLAIDAVEARATLRPEHVAELCRGHFPGEPLVPGALLVGVMADLASRVAGAPGRAPAAVLRATFLRRVSPADTVVVIASGDGRRADAEVRVGGAPAARASFRFAEPA